MKNQNHEKSIGFALVMGLLTMIFCLVIADGLLGIQGSRVDNGGGTDYLDTDVKTGAIVFWIFLIGLPVLVAKCVRWVHTIPHLLLYFALYFPVSFHFGSSISHTFLDRAGLFSVTWLSALITAVVFWGVQSVIFIICDIARYVWKKCKNA